MRFANLSGRLVLLDGERAVDVEQASGGAFAADPGAMFDDWDGLLAWAAHADTTAAARFDPRDLGPPVPRPRQIFAIALNYPTHTAESRNVAPEVPLVFTKFPASITGPHDTITLPPGHVDWEIELVAVIKRDAFQVAHEDAWDVVAGLTIGQDLSERVLQLTGAPPQFSLAKSHPGFGPIGPALVTLDEVPDPDDLPLLCTLSGQTVQKARTGSMLFSVPDQIVHITAVCPVFAGDLIFTGTPEGVGNRMTPPRFITPDDDLVSTIGHLGEMRHTFVSRPADSSRARDDTA